MIGDVLLDRLGDSWFWTVVSLATFGIGSMMCGLVIMAFKPENVDPTVRALFHAALGLFVLRRFVGVVTVSPVVYDWTTAIVSFLVALATVALLLAIVRAIEDEEIGGTT